MFEVFPLHVMTCDIAFLRGIKLHLQQEYKWTVVIRLSAPPALVQQTALSHAPQYCTQRAFSQVCFSPWCVSLLPLISSVCGVCPPKDTSDKPKTNYPAIIPKEAMAHHWYDDPGWTVWSLRPLSLTTICPFSQRSPNHSHCKWLALETSV